MPKSYKIVFPCKIGFATTETAPYKVCCIIRYYSLVWLRLDSYFSAEYFTQEVYKSKVGSRIKSRLLRRRVASGPDEKPRGRGRGRGGAHPPPSGDRWVWRGPDERAHRRGRGRDAKFRLTMNVGRIFVLTVWLYLTQNSNLTQS